MILQFRPAGGLILRRLPSGATDLDVTRDPEKYVRAKLASRIGFWLGEWWADIRQGVPYREVLFQGRPLPSGTFLRGLFVQIAASIPYVDRVASCIVTLDPKNRRLSVRYFLVLSSGDTIEIDPDLDSRFILSIPQS